MTINTISDFTAAAVARGWPMASDQSDPPEQGTFWKPVDLNHFLVEEMHQECNSSITQGVVVLRIGNADTFPNYLVAFANDDGDILGFSVVSPAPEMMTIFTVPWIPGDLDLLMGLGEVAARCWWTSTEGIEALGGGN